MSIEATRAVWRFSQANGTARLVLLAIADNADDGGHAYPGHETLAEKCLVSRRSIIDNIRKLEHSGELVVRHRRNVGNAYLIALGELPQIHSKHHEQRTFKCRVCTYPNVQIEGSNVQIDARYVKPSVSNVKQASHEPSRTAFDPSINRGNASRKKRNPNCPECGDKKWDCHRCSQYGKREAS